MKKTVPIITLLLLVLLALSCRHDRSSVPLKFTAYEGNPLLSPGNAGSFDELIVGAPQVIFYENMYYMFYLASDKQSRMSVGLAISDDGLHFAKFDDNPVLAPDNKGFDAYTASAGIVVRIDSTWAMYYNGQELASHMPGPAIGRATASLLTGPWVKEPHPVLTSGRKGEWDAGFIIPSSVLALKDGRFLLYYSGGVEIEKRSDFYIGLAFSDDGIRWNKYNDPATKDHPFAESDPVVRTGAAGDWDENYLWMANVILRDDGFQMYFTWSEVKNDHEILSIGHATSKDGIHWEKSSIGPIFSQEDDPYAISLGAGGNIENSFVLYTDSVCFLYYDYCGPPGEIGVATARVP